MMGSLIAKLLHATLILFFLFFTFASIAGADITLVPSGSSWKYLDDGSNQGTAWRSPSFSDSSWKTGNAQLGYGDGDEATIVSYGPNPDNRYITTYFRKTFSVSDASIFSGLIVRILRDDGAVVYLNGTEIARSNMPTGTISYTTPSATSVSGTDEDFFFSHNAGAGALVNGTNVLAVEVHQRNGSSSDISLDLQLIGQDDAPPPPPSGGEIVSKGSSWKYLDNGSNQGTAWRSLGFSDSTWQTGNAQFGYGEGDEATVVSYGPNSSNRYITTYFRKTVSISDPSSYSGLTLRVLRDDGAVVYINGTEVWRTNMPSGSITYTTLAAGSVGGADESTFFETNISPSFLISGTNVIAVEVHQRTANSNDLSFDLELIPSTSSGTPVITRGPYLQIGTANSMRVHWRTNVPTNSRVRYGTNANNLANVKDDLTTTTEHVVTLTGLNGYTKYFYSIGTTSNTLVSGTDYYFFTSPQNGHPNPSRIWILGDSGTGNSNARAVRDAFYAFNANRYTDVWLMLGDNAYETGTDAEYQAAVFDMYPRTLRNSPLWPTLGNHDTAFSTNPPDTIPYYQIFNLPKNGEAGGLASGTEDYYSFDYGTMHFVCLDSMTSSRSPSGAMLTWLKNDLSATRQPWIIAFWHHPPYSKGSHDSDSETPLIEMRQNAVKILEDHGVDLVLTGHSHSYERSFFLDGHYGFSNTLTNGMIKNGGNGREDGNGAYTKPQRTPHAGAVYVVAGSSGKTESAPLNHPAVFISLLNLGSVVLDVEKDKLQAKFLRENGTIADYYTIRKLNNAPQISITSPSSGSTHTAGSNITITANVVDEQLRRVRFYRGTTHIATDYSAPYSVTWSNVPAGNYSLTAVAEDILDSSTTSAPVSITVR